jgi:RNA polymerase sigma-70 factor (ECF subfamily)
MQDRELVQALRRGDEKAFYGLVRELHPTMVHAATRFVGSGGKAEEVVQDTWIAVIEGIERFELRSSLRTWIFGILLNRLRTAAYRERRRAIDTSQLASADLKASFPADPAFALLHSESLRALSQAVAALPATQWEVLRLRGFEGWTSEEVAKRLRLSAGNQRVLLHRARAHLRQVLRP